MEQVFPRNSKKSNTPGMIACWNDVKRNVKSWWSRWLKLNWDRISKLCAWKSMGCKWRWNEADQQHSASAAARIQLNADRPVKQ
jgi:hypothetical protein